MRLYSIGLDTAITLEQYSFEGTNININNLILKQYEAMNVELQNLGIICFKEKIKSYSEIVSHNF